MYTLFVIPSETGADSSILDNEQIENIFNEDIEFVYSTYEHTEQILNDIQLHNLGDDSFFTGNFNIIFLFSDLLWKPIQIGNNIIIISFNIIYFEIN